ncbi:MAG: lytic transglycosylase domain-containing protein [Bacteroidetes bacterium]|nr:lytic transglycosylase domain-containing protein [Bacteroidota bacterium]
MNTRPFALWLCLFLSFICLDMRHQRDRLAVKVKLNRKALANQQWEIDRARDRNRDLDELLWMRRATELRHADWALITKTIYRKANEYNLRPDLMLAVAHRESNFNPFAQSSVARGVMQINYNVWAEPLALDEASIYDIEKNIDAGCKIMRMYLDEAGGDEIRALNFYNCGYLLQNPRYVPRIQSSRFYQAAPQ